jgi:hypothetical protein
MFDVSGSAGGWPVAFQPDSPLDAPPVRVHTRPSAELRRCLASMAVVIEIKSTANRTVVLLQLNRPPLAARCLT